MAQPAFEEIVEDFAFLDEWEDRYRMVIEMGRDMPPMEDALKVPATKVEGCASQVWLHIAPSEGRLYFQGDSDAMIVKGLIAVLRKLYEGVALDDVTAIDARAEMGRLGLTDHLSSQRSNGLRAMIERIRAEAG